MKLTALLFALTLTGCAHMAWILPTATGCPRTHPVKGNADSHVYHLPGSRFYDKVKPERCFKTALDAEEAGFRAPQEWLPVRASSDR